jgi:dihydroorotate dehydrogenase
MLFLLSPERAHNLGMSLIAAGLVRSKLLKDPRLPVEAMGLRFPNPLGLAAGFDKDAEAVARWEQLGFGFAEVGTVTRWPQPGNRPPRLFRLPADRALINRMGFNNRGAASMARRLSRLRGAIPVGVNLGKSRITPLEQAGEDYAWSFERLRAYGDYFVVNVSSPNTPGLRSLQEKGALAGIVAWLREIDPSRPLLIKVAPDLTTAELDDIVEVAAATGAAGLIATNTTLRRERLRRDPGEEGGLSGAPMAALADEVLGYLASARPAGMTLIGVGGIFTGADMARKVRLGATLVQAYTGFVYRGPGFAPRVLAEYLAEIERDT